MGTEPLTADAASPAGRGAAAARDLRRRRDPGDRHPPHRDALHPRGRQLEQVRHLGGRDQRAERRDGRPERAREPSAVEALADDHPPAVKAVLAPARLHGGGDRLAHLAAVGGDDGLEPEQAAVLGALGGAHLGPVERRPQPALGQPPALLAHELVLVPAVEAAGELLEERRGRGQLEAHDRRRALRDLGAGDLLKRRGRLLFAVGDQRVDEASLLAKPHHVPRLAQHAGSRTGLLAVHAAEPDVGVGGADRAVERGDRLGLQRMLIDHSISRSAPGASTALQISSSATYGCPCRARSAGQARTMLAIDSTMSSRSWPLA